jgi:hypothetical protein
LRGSEGYTKEVSEISTPRLTPLKYFRQGKDGDKVNNFVSGDDINDLEMKIKNIEQQISKVLI